MSSSNIRIPVFSTVMRLRITSEGTDVDVKITEPVMETSSPLTTDGNGLKSGHKNGQSVRGAEDIELESSIASTETTSDCLK